MPEASPARPALARRFRTLQAAVCVAAGALLAASPARSPLGTLAGAALLHGARGRGVPAARPLRPELRRPGGRRARAGDPHPRLPRRRDARLPRRRRDLEARRPPAPSDALEHLRRRAALVRLRDRRPLQPRALLRRQRLGPTGGARHRSPARLLLHQHGAGLRLPRARPHGAARTAARDRPLPAHGAPPAGSDRHPRGPRLRGLRTRRRCSSRSSRSCSLPSSSAASLRWSAASPRSPGETASSTSCARSRRASAEARASTDTSGSSPPSPGSFPSRPWPSSSGRAPTARISPSTSRSGRPRPAARYSPGRGAGGSTSAASTATAPPRSSLRETPARSASLRERTTRSASGCRPSSSTRACSSSRARAPLCTPPRPSPRCGRSRTTSPSSSRTAPSAPRSRTSRGATASAPRRSTRSSRSRTT